MVTAASSQVPDIHIIQILQTTGDSWYIRLVNPFMTRSLHKFRNYSGQISFTLFHLWGINKDNPSNGHFGVQKKKFLPQTLVVDLKAIQKSPERV